MSASVSIDIFDTTLRDGDQGHQTPFLPHEKIHIAHLLADARVDVIEAGFGASRTDSSVREVARSVWRGSDAPAIASLSRLLREDIDHAYESIRDAQRGRIHTFIATSDDHLMTKFSDTWKCSSVEQLRSEAIRRIHEIISYAKKTDREIQWSAEDAIHSDKDFLLSACRVAITSGATIINIPDTLGLALPWEIEDIFRFLTFGTEDLRSQGYSFIFSTHNHNDGGNAVANTLAAIRGGARQAECTINNIGERAGNASLSSIVGNIRERSRAIIPNVSCHVRCLPQAQYRLSQAVEAMTGIKSTPHTPFVWTNTRVHGAGIHQHGAVKSIQKTNRDIYCILEHQYGVPDQVPVFNARSGIAQAQHMLRGVGEIAPDFPWSTYLFTLSQKAEITRGICASNMEHAYREQIGIEHVHISADDTNISVDIISSGKTFQAHIDRRKPIEEQLITQLGNTAQKVTLSLTSRGDDLLKDWVKDAIRIAIAEVCLSEHEDSVVSRCADQSDQIAIIKAYTEAWLSLSRKRDKKDSGVSRE